MNSTFYMLQLEENGVTVLVFGLLYHKNNLLLLQKEAAFQLPWTGQGSRSERQYEPKTLSHPVNYQGGYSQQESPPKNTSEQVWDFELVGEISMLVVCNHFSGVRRIQYPNSYSLPTKISSQGQTRGRAYLHTIIDSIIIRYLHCFSFWY